MSTLSSGFDRHLLNVDGFRELGSINADRVNELGPTFTKCQWRSRAGVDIH